MDTVARNYSAKVHCEDGNKRIYHSLYPDAKSPTKYHDQLQYGDRFDHKDGIHHKDGQVALQAAIDVLVHPPHPWIPRDFSTHFAGSGMFIHHEKDGCSNIYCTRHATVPSDLDIYDGMIHPMAVATEQQIVFGRAND